MFSRSICLVLALCCLYSNAMEIEKGQPIHKVLEKFVKILEENEMNVSVIASKNEKYNMGQLKETLGFTLHLPSKQAHLTESSWTLEKGKQFVSEVEKLIGSEKVAATVKIIKIENGHVVKELVETTDKHLNIDTWNYDLLTNVTNGKIGLVMDNPNHVSMFNYIVAGPDGKNETITVMGGNLDVIIEDRSKQITDPEIKIMKSIIPKLYLSLDDNDSLAKLLVNELDEKLPSLNWQVIIDAEDFYVTSSKWIQFKVADTTILIFSLV